MDFEVKEGYMRGIDEFDMPSIQFAEPGETGNWDNPSSSSQVFHNETSQWVMQAKVGTNFWANRAQLPEAKERARKVLLYRIYEPFVRQIHELRLAISDGDKSRAYKILDKMEDISRGEE